MTDIDEALDNLIDALLETDEYIRYTRARKDLDQHPDIKEKVDEFRRRNFELQTSDLDGPRLMEQMDKFEREYEQFRSNPLVYKFLESELAFVRLMQGIYGSIMESIDFE